MGHARAVALLIGIAMLAGQCGLWFLCGLRLRGMSARLELGLLEREHALAGLYDELLQDMQGLTLTLQSIADRLPRDEPARESLERVLGRADEILATARERVRALRMLRGGPSV